jgi:hypothetical protein
MCWPGRGGDALAEAGGVVRRGDVLAKAGWRGADKAGRPR